jgi:hypothetical protein
MGLLDGIMGGLSGLGGFMTNTLPSAIGDFTSGLIGNNIAPTVKGDPTGAMLANIEYSMSSPTKGLLASDFASNPAAFNDAMIQLQGSNPNLYNRAINVMSSNPNDFIVPSTYGGGASGANNFMNNSQGLLSSAWGGLTSEPFTNAARTGMMGYGMYNQGKLADQAINTMQQNQAMSAEAWQREKDRQDKAANLQF